MLEVTGDALDLLNGLLDNNEVEEEQLIRLTANEEGSLGLAIDAPRQGDRVISSGERDVLVVEPALDQQLSGAVMTVAGEGSDQLTIVPKDGSGQ